MIPFTPIQAEDFKHYFEAQASQSGFGFVGHRYQRGSGLGSIFSGLFRAVAPLAKSAIKTVGKTAATTGLQIASDALQGRNLSEAVEHRTKEAAGQLIEKGKRKLVNTLSSPSQPPAKRRRKKKQQRGKGLGFRNEMRLMKSIKGDDSDNDDVFAKDC